jgi:hypothetical protein
MFASRYSELRRYSQRLFPLFVEVAYLMFCLLNVPPLLRATVGFLALFIIPGMSLLTLFPRTSNESSLLRHLVEGFFVSTILAVLCTCFFILFKLPVIPLAYSLTISILVLVLLAATSRRDTPLKFSRRDVLVTSIIFLLYCALMMYFGTLPRVLSPDEASYLFSARIGLSGGEMLPMGTHTHDGDFSSLFNGRYFWIYLVTSFLGSTGLPAYYAGLLNVGFLVMTALASTLFIPKTVGLRSAIFALVITSPFLFLFSARALNDLTASFYAVLAVWFFIKSFSEIDGVVSISFVNLAHSLVAATVLILIKPNLLIFIVMGIILVYFTLKYRSSNLDCRYKILLMGTLVLVLSYELVIDVPYVISVWIVRSSELASIFQRFLPVSPFEHFIGMFLAPPWDPTASTLLTCGATEYLDYFYSFLEPESLSLVVSASILAIPALLLLQDRPKDVSLKILASLVFMSFYIFFFQAVSLFSLVDISRYSLWMVVIWIPLSLTQIRRIIENGSFRKILAVFLVTLILLGINLYITGEKGGVYTNYRRTYTADIIILQIVFLALILSLVILKRAHIRFSLSLGKRLSVVKRASLKEIGFYLLITVTLLNGFYFIIEFMNTDPYYKDHGFIEIRNALHNATGNGSLIFANNYIYIRPYVSDELFENEILLPPPDTEEDFFELIQIAPNNTLVLLSDDDATTWYEYANDYIINYTYSGVIASNASISAYAKCVHNEVLRFGQFSVFETVSFGDRENSGELTVSNTKVRLLPNRTVILSLNVLASKPENVTVLLGTMRFTKVHSLSLESGINNVEFRDLSVFGDKGRTGRYFSQVKVLIINSEGNLAYDESITNVDLRIINYAFTLIIAAVLSVYFVCIKFPVKHSIPHREK